MRWNLKQRKYMASEKKDGKAFRGQWAYCMFFFVHYCYGWKQESKSREEEKWFRSNEEDVEECSSNNCGMSFWIVFNWPEYGISSFAEHISREFLTAEFDLISCKAIRSRGRLTILYLFIVNTVTSVVCSIAI